MFIELVGQLRCTREHEYMPLVATAYEIHERDIVNGVLGCPICHAEYPVIDSVTHFSDASVQPESYPTSDYEALRAAALLDLQNSRLTLLSGAWCALAPAILNTWDAHLVLLNPSDPTPRPGASAIVCGSLPPFAARALDSLAADESLIRAATPDRCAALVRDGGRMVAPHETGLPPTARLLASDDRHWVAEVSHPALTSLSVRRAGR